MIREERHQTPTAMTGEPMSGSMSLAGTYEIPDFPEVLGLLSRRGCTGRLQLRAGSRHATVRLLGGGAVAVEGVASSWSEAGTDVRGLLEEVFFEALRAGRGSFEFQPDQGVHSAEMGVSVELASAVSAAQQRLEEWREVETVIPSLDSVPRLREGLEATEITVSQEEWRILVSIDGRRTVGGIARRLGRKPVAVCKVLKPLVEHGAVGFERPETVAIELPVVGITRPGLEVEADPAPSGTSEADAGDGNSGAPAPRRRGLGPAFRVLAR
jgi:hypothetical protein